MLQLDSASSYGSHWSTLQLDHFLDWARSQQGAHDAAPMSNGIAGSEGPMHSSQHSSSSGQHVKSNASAPSQWLEVPIEGGPALYANVEVEIAAGASLGPSREYNIDLAPKVTYLVPPVVPPFIQAHDPQSCGASACYHHHCVLSCCWMCVILLFQIGYPNVST